MPDLAHTFGSDLAVGPSGDLSLSDGTQLTQDRVLKRLMTNAGAYIWHLKYGAGLPGAVGRVVNAARIQAVIRAQMMQESRVSRNPPPVVTVTADNAGTVFAFIKYTDAVTGSTQTLNLPGI